MQRSRSIILTVPHSCEPVASVVQCELGHKDQANGGLREVDTNALACRALSVCDMGTKRGDDSS